MGDVEIYVDEDDDPVANNILQKYHNMTQNFYIPPPPVWKWNILGITMGPTFLLPHIGWWKRMWTRIFFGSTWEKL